MYCFLIELSSQLRMDANRRAMEPGLEIPPGDRIIRQGYFIGTIHNRQFRPILFNFQAVILNLQTGRIRRVTTEQLYTMMYSTQNTQGNNSARTNASSPPRNN